MSVLFSPLARLRSTRVCQEVEVPADPDSWQQWCLDVVRDGVGMICVRGGQADHLTTARHVVGNRLVAVCESEAAGQRADVIHLNAPVKPHSWPGLLVGCSVATVEELDQAREVGCAYVVVDHRADDLVARLATGSPDLVWFVQGCSTVDDLRRAVGCGARRVWLDPAHRTAARPWAEELRAVWRTDPAIRGLDRLKERLL